MRLKIAQFGYGKTGKEIHKIILERGHEFVGFVDSGSNLAEKKDIAEKADVVIDFTNAEAMLSNLNLCVETHTQLVVGTTGWYNNLEIVKEIVDKSDIGFIYSGNFSPGVNIFFQLNIYLAKLMSVNPEYSSQIHEIHHTEKLDTPSGTAIQLANQIIENHQKYSGWNLEEENSQDINSLPISHERVFDEKGTHFVKYQNEIDLIEIKHKAFNRKGFALGAVLASEFIVAKKGFFTSKDLYKF